MVKGLSVLILLVLAGCAGTTAYTREPSACVTQGEASYECQIFRYSTYP